MDKSRVVIARKWLNPQIEINVNIEGISIGMDLRDFLHALADEAAEKLVANAVSKAGNPTFWFTSAAAQRKVVEALESDEAVRIFEEAAAEIVAEIKKLTVRI